MVNHTVALMIGSGVSNAKSAKAMQPHALLGPENMNQAQRASAKTAEEFGEIEHVK